MANRFQKEALTQAALRYGGQEFALAELLAQARGDRNQTIKAAEGAARGTRAALQSARDPLRQDYFEAGLSRQTANADTDRILGGLDTSNPLVALVTAANARERNSAKTQIATDQANALGELTRRGVEASTAASTARVQADRGYRSAKAKIREQAVALAGEKGLFTTQTLNNLLNEHREGVRANRRIEIEEGRAAETARHNRQTEADAAADNRRQEREDKKKNKNPYSRESRVANKDKYDRAFQKAVELRDAAIPTRQDDIIAYLTETQSIPPLIARAAVQTAIGGGAGRSTKKRVKNRYGIAVPGFTPERNRKAKDRHRRSRGRTSGAGAGSMTGPLINTNTFK